MKSEYFGAESTTDEDRAYRGSRFSEVQNALFANPYQKVWGREGESPLPVTLTCIETVSAPIYRLRGTRDARALAAKVIAPVPSTLHLMR